MLRIMQREGDLGGGKKAGQGLFYARKDTKGGGRADGGASSRSYDGAQGDLKQGRGRMERNPKQSKSEAGGSCGPGGAVTQ